MKGRQPLSGEDRIRYTPFSHVQYAQRFATKSFTRSIVSKCVLLAVVWGYLGLLGIGRSTVIAQRFAPCDGEDRHLPAGLLAGGPVIWASREDNDGEVDSHPSGSAGSEDDILPRPKRKHRKAREDQGLPEDAELDVLARGYLKHAHNAWPELVKSGLLPSASDPLILQMIEQFKKRHRSGKIDVTDVNRFVKAGLLVAACYPRYSDPNSQPKSIPDQLRIAITCAKTRGFFVPWGLIVADYARRATWGRRQGFENLLKIIGNRDIKLSAVIIDDFDRGSRNDLDSWKLAGKCKMLKIGLYGASDGFHIDDPNWDQQVRLRNMFNQMEYTSKRQRVRRGLSGLASENRPIGRLALGFARRPPRDQNGIVLSKPNGLPKTERCFDPEMKAAAELMWDLFYNKKWSTYKIAVEFNRLRIDGGDSWSDKSIEQMLTNPAYIGLFIWNRTTKVFNWETQKYETVKNPWQEWIWYYDPELAIVPKSWHVYARNLLVKPKVDPSRKKRKQPQRLPTTLFSGAIFCGYCGRELTLCRATEKYKSLGCPDGLFNKHGCELRSSKSTAIIEKVVCGFLHAQIVSKCTIKRLVIAANKYLAVEQKKPLADLQPLRSQQKKLRAHIDRFLGRVKAAANEDLIEAYEKEISKLQTELKEVSISLAHATRANEPPPPPIDMARVDTYFKDLRAVLNQEIPAAAHALRKVTGPIVATQTPYSDKPGAQWTLTFTPSIWPLLHEVALRLDYPDSSTMEFLCRGNWITSEAIRLPLNSEGWRRRRMSTEFYETLDDLLRHNPTMSQAEIARKAGCSQAAVSRHKSRLLEEGGVRLSE